MIEKWRQWEQEVAELTGGEQCYLSGRLPLHKGDVKTETLLIECKYTDKDYYILHAETWDKILREALNEQRNPALAIRTNGGDFVLLHPTYPPIEGKHYTQKVNGKKSTRLRKRDIGSYLQFKNCGITVVESMEVLEQ